MKKTIMNVGIIIFLLAMGLASCNSDCERKLAVLQKSYDSLIVEKVLLESNSIENRNSKATVSPEPYDNEQDATNATSEFRGLTTGKHLKIPVAYLFKSSEIGVLTQNYPYLRFYASILIIYLIV